MAATAPLPSPPTRPSALRLLAEQSFSRAAGAPLLAGNGVDLLIDARAAFDAWLAAIRGAERSILFENYIFRDDALGREFVAALAERAAAGVRVCVVRDWLGCLGQSGPRLWAPLVAAGGEVRAYNPPRLASPFGWLSRDHRKLLVIDHAIGFVGGICVSGTWLGDAARGIEPWRDTAVAVRGPAVLELAHAFAEVWSQLGEPLPPDDAPAAALPSGQVDLRVVATVPNTAGLYRLDQLIAGMARRNLWLTDAYFVGVAPYVQALIAAARDGVDVRLLVPGSSDIPAVGSLSRAGYRPLLEAGIRVFEWNGSMLHAKTAVADGRWARVGSSNLNLASWIGNCEIDLAIGRIFRPDEVATRNIQVEPLGMLNIDSRGNVSSFSPELLGLKNKDYGDYLLGNLGDEGARALLASPGVRGLKRLDLHHHFMSDAVAAEFARLGVPADVGDQKKPEKYGDGEEYRFITVGE